jgi:phosphopantothenoylcysteine decarboxylase/phosphopantothenate--cysteine ligase
MDLRLVPNPDIITAVSNGASRPSLVVGFAAETENVKEYALHKLTKKSLDYIFANDVSDASIGFDSDRNAGVLIGQSGNIEMPISTKRVLAEAIIGELSRHLD